MKTIKIPKFINGGKVTSIGDKALLASKLKNVKIPDSVTTIGDSAFSKKQLTSVKIPDSVTTIGDSAFSENQLTSVKIPDSVINIRSNAFSRNQLTSVTIGNSVKIIGVSAFSENKLTSVTIGNSVTTIGILAFSKNELTSVTIGNSVKIIGAFAFIKNELTSITIPESVTIIENFAFSENKLTSITILGDETRFNEGWESFGFPKELIPISDKKNKEQKISIDSNSKQKYLNRVVLDPTNTKCNNIYKGDLTMSNIIDDLKNLKLLLDENAITQDEYDIIKKRLISEPKKESFNRSMKVQEIKSTEFIPNVLEGKQIVVTGTLKHFTRETIKETIEKLGGRVQSDVNTTTSFLLVGFENVGTKLDKAQTKKIEIIEETEFLELITNKKSYEMLESDDVSEELKTVSEIIEILEKFKSSKRKFNRVDGIYDITRSLGIDIFYFDEFLLGDTETDDEGQEKTFINPYEEDYDDSNLVSIVADLEYKSKDGENFLGGFLGITFKIKNDKFIIEDIDCDFPELDLDYENIYVVSSIGRFDNYLRV